MTDPRPFRRHPARYLDDPEASAAAVVHHLASTAGAFDRLTADTDPARVGATDLLAISMLGPPVPPPAVAWILGDEGQWLTTEVLADIPVDARLWDCGASAILRSADLFALLRATTSQVPVGASRRAMGQATATRILAAKRPSLCPLDDREMRGALRYDKDPLWFRRWSTTLDADLLALVREARSTAAEEDPAAAGLSELRVLDIVIRRRSRLRRG